jgi:hypothetical protein
MQQNSFFAAAEHGVIPADFDFDKQQQQQLRCGKFTQPSRMPNMVRRLKMMLNFS